jgi:hypothetical protein
MASMKIKYKINAFSVRLSVKLVISQLQIAQVVIFQEILKIYKLKIL